MTRDWSVTLSYTRALHYVINGVIQSTQYWIGRGKLMTPPVGEGTKTVQEAARDKICYISSSLVYQSDPIWHIERITHRNLVDLAVGTRAVCSARKAAMDGSIAAHWIATTGQHTLG